MKILYIFVLIKVILISGNESIKLQIIGGTEANPHSHPYMAAIYIRNDINERLSNFCGGTLISRRFVLTAAHCPKGIVASCKVVLGSHDMSLSYESTRQIINGQFIAHKKFSTRPQLNDIAIIKLNNLAVLNDYVKLIELPLNSSFSQSYEGRTGTIVGWGKSRDTEKEKGVLRNANVQVMSSLYCQNAFPFTPVTKKHICTDGKQGKVFCKGDSGGPLIIDGVQIGIVSYGGFGTCEDGRPGVYTRVDGFLWWIRHVTKIKNLGHLYV